MCLTLSPATADFPKAGSLTQPVEPLLFDQLHDLRLDLFPQLPAEQHTVMTSESYTEVLLTVSCSVHRAAETQNPLDYGGYVQEGTLNTDVYFHRMLEQ